MRLGVADPYAVVSYACTGKEIRPHSKCKLLISAGGNMPLPLHRISHHFIAVYRLEHSESNTGPLILFVDINPADAISREYL